MNNQTIAVLGGGVGGIVVANELRRRLPAPHRIVVIEKNRDHAFAPSFLWLMTGDRKPGDITVPIGTLVRPGIELIHAEATAIDLAGRRIVAEAQSVHYDFLVLALGADLDPGSIPGLVETAYSFYTIEEARKLRDALDTFAGGSIAVVVCSLPYKCPGAPHEGAMLIADYFRRRGCRDKVEIHLFTPESQPMPVTGPLLGEAVREALQSKGVIFHPLHKLATVDPRRRELRFDDDRVASYDLLVAIPPHRAPGIARAAGLSNEAGWIPVNPGTLETKAENVFAIGDITAIPIPGRWKPDVPMMLPKAGVFAHGQAEVVAKRIIDAIDGVEPSARFCGAGYCMLEAGEGLAGFASGDFFGEPSPTLELRKIGRVWHISKVLFEEWWLSPFGIKRTLLGLMINIGGRLLRIPVKT